MNVFLNNKSIRLDPSQAFGKGGEADVYKVQGKAIKIFKQPNHPDLTNSPEEQAGARHRLQIHQTKLPNFPKNLPSKVISPEGIVKDKAGNILGYSMPLIEGTEVLLRYSDKKFRRSIPSQSIVDIFLSLHETVGKIHDSNVVIGDFNDLNILVKNSEAYVIDADSFQFKSFPCTVFTARFVDPLVCDPNANGLVLSQTHNWESDWYAFTVMLMQSLLFVDPYGGIYRPKDASKRVTAGLRPLHRITVFNPEVRYPKPALPLDRLPEELLEHFKQVFENDLRGKFPRQLLESLHWQVCPSCSTEHARSYCPVCQKPIQVAPQIYSGAVTVTLVFETSGVIALAKAEQSLRYLVCSNNQFTRESNQPVIEGQLELDTFWHIQGPKTWVSKAGIAISTDGQEKIAVDNYQGKPQFATNDKHAYWLSQGQLLCDRNFVGSILKEQTQFWVGSHFGLGFYRAGQLKGTFIFDAEKAGINDQVDLNFGSGQIVLANCTFSKSLAWLFVTIQKNGKLHQQCWVVSRKGEVLAEADVKDWSTSTSSICPHLATGDGLFAATDEGIVRVEVVGKQIQIKKRFLETEPYVQSGDQILAGANGLYVVNSSKIQLIQIK